MIDLSMKKALDARSGSLPHRFAGTDRPWWWEWAPRDMRPPGALPKSADVVIVGSGYAGLSAALTLARAGREVMVLDAGVPGHGASSRSGGMIGSGHVVPFERLSRLYGDQQATAILREGLHSFAFTKDLIESEGIECHFRQVGRLRAAWRPQDFDMIRRDVDLVTKWLDYDVTVLAKEELAEELSTDRYAGACVYNRHGGLHPAMFHSGLLDVVVEAGARVFGGSKVLGIDDARHRKIVRTERGEVATSNVIVATNGYTFPELRPFAQRLIRVHAYLIATEVIGQERTKQIIRRDRMVVETRWRHCYYRRSPDGERILFGARVSLGAVNLDRAAKVIRKLMVELYPELEDVGVTHCWTGQLGFARDFLPHIGEINGVHYALACNGSGVAMQPYTGHKAALKVLGSPEGKTAFDSQEFRPIHPFYGGRPWFRPFLSAYYRMKDFKEGSN